MSRRSSRNPSMALHLYTGRRAYVRNLIRAATSPMTLPLPEKALSTSVTFEEPLPPPHKRRRCDEDTETEE